MSEAQFETFLEKTWICSECGQEVECGLMNAVNHWSACLENAPNMDINSHRREVEREKKNKIYQTRWDKVYTKMTVAERETDFLNSMCGFYDHSSNTVLMGVDRNEENDQFQESDV